MQKPNHNTLAQWIRDPVEFVRDMFGAEPDNWQKNVLRDYARHNRIAMKACKGPGKTTVLAWIGWHFLCTRIDPKVVATSVTADNLSDGLWAEFAKWQGKSPILQTAFQWNKTSIENKAKPQNWFASARTWSKTSSPSDQASTLAGLHADSILFLIDEAGSTPIGVGAAAEATLSGGGDSKLIMAGNPEQTDGLLYHACTTAAHLYRVTEITADPDDPDRTPRVSAEWAREQIEMYGRDNPWVMVNVLGKFPPSGINALLGPDEVQAAMKRRLPGNYSLESQPLILGIDVARFGDDRTVIYPRWGRTEMEPTIMRKADSNEVAAKVAYIWDQLGATIGFIDDTGGWASGVIDNLKNTKYKIIPINAGGSALDDRYFNKRSEMAFLLADWIKTGGVLRHNPDLVRELTAATYTFQKNKFRLEEKAQIKARLGYSPDLHDALALTFAQPVAEKTTPAYNPSQNLVYSGGHGLSWLGG